jgi:hypothetical protein
MFVLGFETRDVVKIVSLKFDRLDHLALASMIVLKLSDQIAFP